MEARIASTRISSILVATLAICSTAASYRTPNFVVSAPTAQFAKQVGDAAEVYRRDLANEWLGKSLDRWKHPCPIHVSVGQHLGAGGATSFVFDRGEVFQWRMNIQGSQERILDSVLPHEVTHTVFATHFRRPLPRWADEGACTTVEHASERAKQDRMLIQFLQTRRGIPFSRMFAMKEYPSDVMPLYSQGYSLAKFLIGHGGKRKFIQYVEDGLNSEQWVETTRRHYDFENLAGLQDTWLAWVSEGSPALPAQMAPDQTAPGQTARPDVLLANATQPQQPVGQLPTPGGDVLMRSQSPDTPAVPASPPAVRQDPNVVPAAFANVAASPTTPAAHSSPFSYASARRDNVPGGDPSRVLLEWSISSPQHEGGTPTSDRGGIRAGAPHREVVAPPHASAGGGFTAPSPRVPTRMAGQRPTMLR